MYVFLSPPISLCLSLPVSLPVCLSFVAFSSCLSTVIPPLPPDRDLALCLLFVCSFPLSLSSRLVSACMFLLSLTRPAILHSPFPLDYPVSSDPDYSAHRPYSGSSGFSMDDDDEHTRRVNNPLGQHPLAQPVSIPASSALRYNSHDVK